MACVGRACCGPLMMSLVMLRFHVWGPAALGCQPWLCSQLPSVTSVVCAVVGGCVWRSAVVCGKP